MSQKKTTLPEGSYGGVAGEKFKPYVSKETTMVEFSFVSIIVGLFIALLFSMSTVYLGLKAGMTIGAGIPASILGVGILKALRRHTVLQDNTIQTMASMGDSIAAGLIFVIASLFLWDMKINYVHLMIILAIGSAFGVFFFVIFRKFLIVQEHGTDIKFPESMAISEVIVNSAAGEGKGFRTIIQGIVLGSIYKFFGQGFGFIKGGLYHGVWRSELGIEIYTSFLGLGYIIGPRIASYMFAGGVLSWFLSIPLISFLGEHINEIIAPGTKLISEMSPSEIWSSYIKFIGVGVVTFGGFISLGKNLPSIVSSIAALAGQKKTQGNQSISLERSEQNTSMKWVVLIAIVAFLILWFSPFLTTGWIPAIITVFLSLLFTAVAGRMVGILGSSNNPVSGMTIASLLIIAGIMKILGFSGQEIMIQAILLGSIVATTVGVSGGVAQSLKVGFIFGGTTKKLNILMFGTLILAAITSLMTLIIFQEAYGIGSAEAPAPQANLMKVIVEGIFGGNLPWDLIFIGGAIAIAMSFAGIPALIIGIGTYLPLSLSTTIFVGGLLVSLVQYFNRNQSTEKKEEADRMGKIFASGLIAGESLSGVLLAVLIILGVDLTSIGNKILSPHIQSVLTFISFGLIIVYFVNKFRVRKIK